MAGPIDPRTLAIIQAMEPAAAERQAIMARDAVMRGPAPAPMQAGLRIAPAPQMGMDEFADVRNPIPQPRGPMTAPQPSATDLMPPQAAGRMQPMPQSFETPIGPAPSRFVPPAGNMLAPDIETGSVAPMPPPPPAPAGNRLATEPSPAPMPALAEPAGNMLAAPTGRRVYDPAAGTNGPRFIYEGGPAPMRAAGGGSAIATGGGAVPATGGAGGAAMPYSGGGDSGGGMGDGFFDFLGGFSRGGLLGGIQGVHLGKQARAKAGLSAQQENMTRQAAKRLGVPDDVANSLDGKSLASLVIDIQKQNMTPKEAKEPTLTDGLDAQGRKVRGYMQGGKFVQVGGAEAGEPTGKSRPLVTPEERAAYGIPEDDRAVYQVDANNEVKRIGDGGGVSISVGDEVADRRRVAEENGLKPGTREYQSYVLEGKLPGDKRETATELKEKWSSEDELDILAQQEQMLTEALGLTDKAYSGGGAGVKGWLGDQLPDVGLFDQDKVAATRRYNQLMSQQAIEAMSQTLKGATTDAEMGRFLEILADPAASADRKKQTINTMLDLVRSRRATATRRARELGSTAPAVSGGDGGAAPSGVDPDVWQYMTPEERALWQ
jgi:hypothetical protein